jgi:alkanesulfonate monooxygenase SsuD/methylene tetrahydromethanopterin reductase-like flavin-dependent oxidoreductase (luciferase family)
VKFGVFYELQIPRPWDEESEYRLFQQTLDQIELADKLGYDNIWAVEHHFLEEYSHCSAPEVLLAAASQRTKNIRIGHSVAQLTTSPPQRVAERVSTLDLVSHGRVEFGMGEAGSLTELEPFGRTKEEKREVWEEALKALVPMMTESATEFHGKYFDFPLRNVLPKPRQKPHPPLWVACTQLDTIAYAGQLGIGALGFQFVGPEMAQAWVHAYYNNFTKRRAPIAGYQPNPGIALVSMFMCSETDELAVQRSDGATFFEFAIRYYSSSNGDRGKPGEVNLWEQYQAWLAERQAEGKGLPRGATSGLVGSPDKLRRRLNKFQESNIDQVLLLVQAGQNKHEDICASLELFAREVMPEFHDREPEHLKWKEGVLSGDIELEEIDLSPHYIKRFDQYNQEMGRGKRSLEDATG